MIWNETKLGKMIVIHLHFFLTGELRLENPNNFPVFAGQRSNFSFTTIQLWKLSNSSTKSIWKRWKIEIESAKANFESSTVVSLLQGHIHNVNSKQGTAKLISCVKTENQVLVKRTITEQKKVTVGLTNDPWPDATTTQESRFPSTTLICHATHKS